VIESSSKCIVSCLNLTSLAFLNRYLDLCKLLVL
jgi:hypothetical protein